MSDRQTFRLVHDAARNGACAAVKAAPQGHVVTIRPANRSLEQNNRLHALLSDIAKSRKMVLAGRAIDDLDDLKCLFVSAWRMETGQPSEAVEGLWGEVVQLRRSTASMSKEELAELMAMIEVWAAQHGVELRT